MKRIYKVILGTTGVPLTTVGALGYHIYHRQFVQTPDPIKIQGFPDDMPEETKNSIILQRKKLMQDDIDTVRINLPVEEFLSKHAADDIQYEDHLRRFEGREEVKCFMLDGAQKWSRLRGKLYKGRFHTQIHSEHHGPTESVIDKTITLSFNNYEAGKNRYRTHYLFELRSDDNQPQKLKRYVMEINGNSLPEENSTFGPIGRLHSWLRRWNGRRCFNSIRKQLEEDKAS